MRWRRILLFATSVALVIGAILVVPFANDALRERRERIAAEPHPIPATEAEQAAILASILREHEYEGVPLPPPEPGEIRPPRPRRLPWLRDRTLTLTPCAQPPPECAGSWMADGITQPGMKGDPLQEIPMRLRQELVLANATSRVLRDPGIAGLTMESRASPMAASGPDFWESFYQAHAGTSGILEASWAVTSVDGQSALIFLEHRCDGLCGTGYLFHLEKRGSRWTILRKQLVWKS